jgi:hypothetical protein
MLSILFERKSASDGPFFIDHVTKDTVRHTPLFVAAKRYERNEKGSVMKGWKATRILQLLPRCLAADKSYRFLNPKGDGKSILNYILYHYARL